MAKYKIILTSSFKRQLKLIRKRNKKIEKLQLVVDMLSDGIKLPTKYRDHSLIDNIKFYECRECHIEPDWLLVYQLNDKELILLLVETGSHSDLF